MTTVDICVEGEFKLLRNKIYHYGMFSLLTFVTSAAKNDNSQNIDNSQITLFSVLYSANLKTKMASNDNNLCC